MNDISKAVSSDWRRHFEGISSGWDDYYKGSDYDSYAKQERARYAVSFVEKYVPVGKRVLDVGCGTGQVACMLAQKGYEVVGIDYSPEMIKLSRQNAESMGLGAKTKFVVGEIEALVSKGRRFDAIVALGYFEYILAPIPVIASVNALLGPSGICIAQIWNRWRLPRLLDFRDGPCKLFNPLAYVSKALQKTEVFAERVLGRPRKNMAGPAPLIRKWYSPVLLDRLMSEAGLSKCDHAGHLFAGLGYDGKRLVPDRAAFVLERLMVELARKRIFGKLQLLGENYIGVYAAKG